jgi:hypothetical protein
MIKRKGFDSKYVSIPTDEAHIAEGQHLIAEQTLNPEM